MENSQGDNGVVPKPCTYSDNTLRDCVKHLNLCLFLFTVDWFLLKSLYTTNITRYQIFFTIFNPFDHFRFDSYFMMSRLLN